MQHCLVPSSQDKMGCAYIMSSTVLSTQEALDVSCQRKDEVSQLLQNQSSPCLYLSCQSSSNHLLDFRLCLGALVRCPCPYTCSATVGARISCPCPVQPYGKCSVNSSGQTKQSCVPTPSLLCRFPVSHYIFFLSLDCCKLPAPFEPKRQLRHGLLQMVTDCSGNLLPLQKIHC